MRFSHGSHDLPAVYFSLGRSILKIEYEIDPQNEDRQMTKQEQMKILKTAYNDLLWHGAVSATAHRAGIEVSTNNPIYVDFCHQRNVLVPGQKFVI